MAPRKNQNEPNELMIVNDVPGEECRIAILQDGHLEELFTERTSTATNVGNIYKGKVVNVEPAIQAAFIDYGEGINGFLHISDLHPKYFPGEERTERVGKKIPRKERPPIQHALKRGQEILVQVLKEGIGTKGPTLTSYLSIPGRLLVLMPDMDRVGVSRKVEDEEKRREMREILDSLGLPDGFGFILRTAGYGKTKTELKRDASYLMRLWKVMEKRIKSVGAPCELYRESDLFMRTVRDVLRPTIKAIVVDSDSAYERASMFLRVAAPRSNVKVVRYHRQAPIFHAFDIERQIELIHAREVPLRSGGRLVFDQTEALVAIDVNSGRSRSARDSETMAFETNCEAADEICRQLRLRDLGGLIVNDLIDMRFVKHRKAIEERFRNLMKKDRAKSTVLPISEFGIIEMTRQRMRPSIRKSHFMDCPHCHGHGELKVPDHVAADATRHVGYLLQYERVNRVEMVCSARVASVLLSSKRRELVRMEDATNKRIDVRVSDAIAADRVDYYAYDQRNADIDVAQLPALTPPSLEEMESETPAAVNEMTEEAASSQGAESGVAMAGDFAAGLDAYDDDEPEATEQAAAPAASTEEGHGKRGRRRRGRRGRRGDRNEAATSAQQTAASTPPPQQAPDETHTLRIHELARELSVTSQEVIDRAESDPHIHHVANALASVSAEEAQAIRHMFEAPTGQAGPQAVDGHAGQNVNSDASVSHAQGQPGKKSRRRRGRRGGKNRDRDRSEFNSASQKPDAKSTPIMSESAPLPAAIMEVAPLAVADDGPKSLAKANRKRRRRRGRGGKEGAVAMNANETTKPAHSNSNAPRTESTASAPANQAASDHAAGKSRPKKRRALYRAGRVAVSPAARESAGDE